MSNLTPIKGFFYSIGSKDIPFGYNHNDKFGFVGNNPEPVFKYSLTNVNNFFYKPLNCVRMKDDLIQTLIIESDPPTELEGLTPELFDSYGFSALFEALHILYDRSDVVNGDLVYKSKGDKLLSETALQNRYESGSLYMDLVTIDGELRISFVKFKFKLFNNTVGTVISVYFIPDNMFETNGLDDGRYTITYSSKDVENTEEGISDILINGLSSILNLEISRNYSNICKFSTPFNVLDENGVITDTYIRTFFIHNVMYKGYEITTYQKIVLVKKFLNSLYLHYGSAGRGILHREYPELFTNNTVDIYPILTPIISGRRLACVSVETIQKEIERRGVTVDLENSESSSRVEVITLEGVGELDNDNYLSTSMANRNFLTPLLVISSDPTLPIGAIKNNFKYFSPLFTGYEVHGETWERFHFLVKLFVKLTTGMIQWKFSGDTDSEISDKLNIPTHMQLKTERIIIYNSEFINSISFDFNDTTYTIHGFYKYGAF